MDFSCYTVRVRVGLLLLMVIPPPSEILIFSGLPPPYGATTRTTCKPIVKNIGLCFACVYRAMDAGGKFGEHERCVRVARRVAENNSSFLSALQTSQVHPYCITRYTHS